MGSWAIKSSWYDKPPGLKSTFHNLTTMYACVLKVFFAFKSTGMFTIKSGYYYLHNLTITTPTSSSSHTVDKNVWKIIWSVNALPKFVTFYLWRFWGEYWTLFTTLPIDRLGVVWQYTKLAYSKYEISSLDDWILQLSNTKTPPDATKHNVPSMFTCFPWRI